MPRVGRRAHSLDRHIISNILSLKRVRVILLGIVRWTPSHHGDAVPLRQFLCNLHGHVGSSGSIRGVILIEKKNVHNSYCDPGAAGQLWRRAMLWTATPYFARFAKLSALSSCVPLMVFFSKMKFPITNTSICVRWKQSSASSGRQTIGSLSLKDVFRTIGTPVACSNVRISCQERGFAS